MSTRFVKRGPDHKLPRRAPKSVRTAEEHFRAYRVSMIGGAAIGSYVLHRDRYLYQRPSWHHWQGNNP